MRGFRKILIANRGEIALRIMRTCREMGIAPLAVFSDADRIALHARSADAAFAIGPSYLDLDRVMDAARKSRADAIHPGYGFLSENAAFAEACEAAGIAFIGPPARAIREMGLKTNGRRAAQEAGVPVVPEAAGEFPLIVKADAGGGGRGMRIVRQAAGLEEALASAKREAERAFGSGDLLIEKYIEGARHVEVQIFGDRHGNVIHLFERDCTTQRRFQKIVEESPCPSLSPAQRERICGAAVALARKIGYVNAGTVEFLLAPGGDFYFIEVNTRIQVEHPVTEMVTGLDLVKLQIEAAEGRPLDVQPRQTGHAIEARLYAEDPENDFLPSTGFIEDWTPPANVRVDSALERGAEIGIHYDPLLAKIIAHAGDRDAALRKLVYALKHTRVAGVKTNRDYLIRELDPEARPETNPETNPGMPPPPGPLSGVPFGYRNNPVRNLPARGAGNAPHRGSAAHQMLRSPMPGQVLRVLVQPGQAVQAGEALLLLEAMKMEQTIRTTIDGVVESIAVRPGQVVAPGQALVEVKARED